MITLEDSYKHRGMRKKLVKLIENKGITNHQVLKAIGKIPRHFFFDNAFVEHAYQDKAFPIGEGQTISQPYTVAFQTEMLNIKPENKVLEIGTGSGYQACVLLELGVELHTIEYQKVLYERTRNFLPKMGYNANFYHGDGSKGIPDQAPFDNIIVTAGAPLVPKSLVNQLKAGGVLIIPVGDNDKQKMYRITKLAENKIKKEAFDFFSFVPLLGKEGWGK
ncbi:MAG: protein-L-isoaspartate(D-aspartate) O-methyltransferase [Cyclobacteriaceae bacterium]|nr:protein-L-isoaspartate(D-aspartate) O-methyltransferase [Cyclobacteriaceae bacterium]